MPASIALSVHVRARVRVREGEHERVEREVSWRHCGDFTLNQHVLLPPQMACADGY